MELNSQQPDYDFVEWHCRPAAVAPPVIKPRAEIDTTRITLATDRELRYWTDELAVTIYEIRDAIAATGTRCSTTVRNYLIRLRTRSTFDLTV